MVRRLTLLLAVFALIFTWVLVQPEPVDLVAYCRARGEGAAIVYEHFTYYEPTLEQVDEFVGGCLQKQDWAAEDYPYRGPDGLAPEGPVDG